MHDNVINNAFFAALAIGATYVGGHAVIQVVYAPQTMEQVSSFGGFVRMWLIGA